MWAGTAINDTSSVVAAGYSYSTAAGDYATIVKLTRATLIIPVCLVLALWVAWREKKQGTSGFSLVRIFPWFILWFLVASARSEEHTSEIQSLLRNSYAFFCLKPKT